MNDTLKRKAGITDYPVHSINPPTSLRDSEIKRVKLEIALKELINVSGNGIAILDYIVNNLNLSSNYIELNQVEIESYLFNTATRSTNAYVYRGILSLLEAGIIFRSITKNYYWLNHSVICLIK